MARWLTAIVGVLSCAGVATAGLGKRCIDDKLVAASSYAATIAQTKQAEGVKGDPVLVESSCRKRVYRFGKYRLIISLDFVASGEPRTTLTQSIEVKRKPTCLADAIAIAQKLDPHTDAIIAKAKRAYGNRWNDPDLGAVIWTQCDVGSTEILLHELNHKARDGNCINVPDGAPLCFTSLDNLPARKLAHSRSSRA